MNPTAYITNDKRMILFADSKQIKQHGFCGMTALYSENDILKMLEDAKKWWSLAPWQPIETSPLNEQLLVKHGVDVYAIVYFTDKTQKRFYQKWLPLPEVKV